MAAAQTKVAVAPVAAVVVTVAEAEKRAVDGRFARVDWTLALGYWREGKQSVLLAP